MLIPLLIFCYVLSALLAVCVAINYVSALYSWQRNLWILMLGIFWPIWPIWYALIKDRDKERYYEDNHSRESEH